MSNASNATPDVIFHNGRITTLDRAKPLASAVAIKDGAASSPSAPTPRSWRWPGPAPGAST